MDNQDLFLLNTLNRGDLNEEEQQVVWDWENGQKLQQLISSPGWAVVIQMFEDYKASAMKNLIAANPADKDLVTTYQSIAHGVFKTIDNFLVDVDNAIDGCRNKSLQQALAESKQGDVDNPFL
jgi:hypothetical protein